MKRSWRGVALDIRSADMMDEVARLTAAGAPYPTPVIRAIQGSFAKGAVRASRGTHDGGGAIDLGLPGWSQDVIGNLILAMRRVGWASWYRPRNWDGRGGGHHVHAVAINCPSLSTGAGRQVVAYIAGRNGLANGAPDPGPRQFVTMTWEKYRAIRSADALGGPPASGPFVPPGGPDSMYGPSTPGKPWYSGKVASAQRSVEFIRDRIRMIQRTVGAVPDGDYGPATATAVRRWQKSNALEVDGVVGEQTWRSLVASAPRPSPAYPIPIPEPLPDGGIPSPQFDPTLPLEPRVPWDPAIVLDEDSAQVLTRTEIGRVEDDMDC